MRQLLISVFVVTGIGLFGHWYWPEFADTDIDWAAIAEREKKLDEAWVNQRRFAAALNRVFCEISYDNLPLAEGIEEIEKAAFAHNPMYVRNICLLKKGTSLQVQIGYNVLYHFESCQNKSSPELIQLIGRLKQELQEICAAQRERFAL